MSNLVLALALGDVTRIRQQKPAEWVLSVTSEEPVSHKPVPTTECAKKAATAMNPLANVSKPVLATLWATALVP